MTEHELGKHSIILIGLGSENYALLSYLKERGVKIRPTVLSIASRSIMEKQYPALKKWKHIKWQTGKPSWSQLKTYSLIIASPGAYLSPSLRRRLKKNKTGVIQPMQLFFDWCPTANIIGVTGTKGKGTTASLIYAILKQGKKCVWLGGNIGIAPLAFLPDIKKNDWVVLELSSFQLQDITTSPYIAVLTNFSPEHLAPADKNNPNYHLSLSHYWQAKYKIFKFQKRSDIAIVNQKLKARIQKEKPRGKVITFSQSKLPSRLLGKHNQENIAAAVAVGQVVGISKENIARAVKNFKGLPYRLEKIATKDGITYYNDSFATTPEATITALKAFPKKVILLAGGADKGADFTVLAEAIAKYTKVVILFKGTALKKLKKSIEKVEKKNKKKILFSVVNSMNEAIKQARMIAKKGDTILLSPACASFGLFKNYKDRGEQFNREVGKIE